MNGWRPATPWDALSCGLIDVTRLNGGVAKVFTTEAYFRVADEGMQILGGYSMTPDFQMERHYRDSRVMRIGGGSNEVMRNSIAKDLGL